MKATLTGGPRAVRAAAALAVLSMAVVAAGPSGAMADETEHIYTAPYEEGPEGGDGFNVVHADADAGRVVLARAYPLYNPLSCAPGGGFVTFEVVHSLADGPVSEVSAQVSDAVLDSYTFVTLSVRTEDGDWLGHARQRGLVVGDEELVAPVDTPDDEDVESLVIHFGVDLASACPHANGGTAVFDSVTVR